MTSRAGAAFGPLLGAGVALVAACSTSSGPALGGPHGGSTFSVGPTQGNSAAVDASYTIPRPPPPTGAMLGTPGTWTYIFNAYLDKGTVGDCKTCHPQMSDPLKSYQWLADEGYLGTSPPALTQDDTSCLSWYGGDMPTATTQSQQARDDMDDWTRTGAIPPPKK
jgi:hypothetical protein